MADLSSLSKIAAAYLENELDYPDGQHYAAIIGSCPSQGARSPSLWNKVFEAQGIQARMLPFDVKKRNLKSLFCALRSSPFFVGGCIAVPYKEDICNLLGMESLSSEACAIGAINSLYRDSNSRIMGTNTDGEAAIDSLQDSFGSLRGKKILVLGAGGAGKAVCSFASKAIGPEGFLVLTSHSSSVSNSRLKSLGINKFVPWGERASILPSVDIVINCTTLGSQLIPGITPLTSEELGLNPRLFVYDIIYQPLNSPLLQAAEKVGLKTLNGLDMNLRQAVLACFYATQKISPEITKTVIRRIMST